MTSLSLTAPNMNLALINYSEMIVFSGTDRIGDADRLSVGVTTRVLDVDDGKEKLSASLGRIFYFRDRNVNLPGEIAEREESSEICGGT